MTDHPYAGAQTLTPGETAEDDPHTPEAYCPGCEEQVTPIPGVGDCPACGEEIE